jgi:hypothetical protein
MKFLRKTANYTLYDHKRNQDIIQELKKNKFWEKLTTIKVNGYDMFAEWTDLNSQSLMKYQPAGKTNQGCPLKSSGLLY